MINEIISAALSPKEAAFCSEYIKTFNGTKAAIAVGYAKSGARSQASKLLSKTNIRQRLQELTAKATDEAILTVKATSEELAAIAHIGIDDYMDGHGCVLPIEEMSPAAKKAIAQFEVRRTESGDEIIKVRCHPKNQALALVAKHLGMLAEKIQGWDENGSTLEALKRGRALAGNTGAVYYVLRDEEDLIRLRELANGRVVMAWLNNLTGETGELELKHGEASVCDLRGGNEQCIYLDHEDAEFEMVEEEPSEKTPKPVEPVSPAPPEASPSFEDMPPHMQEQYRVFCRQRGIPLGGGL